MSENTQLTKFGVGDFITLVDGEPVKAVNLSTGEEFTVGHYGEPFKGDVLKVLAIDGPFVVVDDLSDRSWGRVTLDMRQVAEARRLSTAYVQAALPKTLPRWRRILNWFSRKESPLG